MARTPSRAARSKMIRAAIELIEEGGVRSVSVDAVARRSGVARTTLYRHFGGADGLIFAAAASDVSEVDFPDSGSLVGDVRAIHEHYIAIARAPISREIFGWMLTRSIQDSDFAAIFRDGRKQPNGPTMETLQRAIARGELPLDINLDLAYHAIQGPLISKRFIDNAEITDRERDQMVAFAVGALVAGSKFR